MIHTEKPTLDTVSRRVTGQLTLAIMGSYPIVRFELARVLREKSSVSLK